VNKAYIKRQLTATLAGRAPPDYTMVDGIDTDETKLKGYVGLDGLTGEARTAFGYGLL
jgi:hypothetical protein